MGSCDVKRFLTVHTYFDARIDILASYQQIHVSLKARPAVERRSLIVISNNQMHLLFKSLVWLGGSMLSLTLIESGNSPPSCVVLGESHELKWHDMRSLDKVILYRLITTDHKLLAGLTVQLAVVGALYSPLDIRIESASLLIMLRC